MSERPTLTIAVPCPTCGGTNRIPRKGHDGLFRDCPDCTDGTIRQAVSCARCKWSEKDIQIPFCHLHGIDVAIDFGCLSWEDKA